MLLYGQMPPTPGLDAFYRGSGFEIQLPGEPIDPWVIFGMQAKVAVSANQPYDAAVHGHDERCLDCVTPVG
ncbi:hypothetical protein [Nonomuraea roseola]|uniref:Uncharacterized protein n=1 Tax=Nonomuraea roseola TaxID=46179 RepID=A0ABV5Q882_9ACTN